MFAPIHLGETYLVEEIYRQIKSELPSQTCLVSPMTVGGHMDHRIVRAAAERLRQRLLYYADYPYAAQHPQELAAAVGSFSRKYSLPVSLAGLQAWQDGIAAYRSQISTFWAGRPGLDAQVKAYWQEGMGNFLWQSVS
jgi:hypothetical protein